MLLLIVRLIAIALLLIAPQQLHAEDFWDLFVNWEALETAISEAIILTTSIQIFKHLKKEHVKHIAVEEGIERS